MYLISVSSMPYRAVAVVAAVAWLWLDATDTERSRTSVPVAAIPAFGAGITTVAAAAARGGGGGGFGAALATGECLAESFPETPESGTLLAWAGGETGTFLCTACLGSGVSIRSVRPEDKQKPITKSGNRK